MKRFDTEVPVQSRVGVIILFIKSIIIIINIHYLLTCCFSPTDMEMLSRDEERQYSKVSLIVYTWSNPWSYFGGP